MFSAGSHTVETVLMIGTYHVLRNPDVKHKLLEELRNAWPALDEPPSYEELEKLPFLASVFPYVILGPALRMGQTAVIKETLRVAVPTPARLPSVVLPSGAMISGVKIPGGVRFMYTCLGPYLMSSTDSCEPESPFRVVWRIG